MLDCQETQDHLYVMKSLVIIMCFIREVLEVKETLVDKDHLVLLVVMEALVTVVLMAHL